MRGHIRRRGKDSFAAVIYLGHGKYRWETVHGTEEDAQIRLLELLRSMGEGTVLDRRRVAVGGYLDYWLTQIEAAVRPKTLKWYKMVVERHLKPELGRILLQKLTPLHLQDYYRRALASGRLRKLKKTKEFARGAGPLSSSAVRGHHRTIHRTLHQALRWGLVGRNVADAVDPPSVERRQYVVLDEAGVEKLLAAARDSRDYALYLAAITTGMRLGELLALWWEDVDLDNGVAHVRQTLTRSGANPQYGPPKSRSAIRQVTLPQALVAALRKRKTAQKEERLKAGESYRDYGLVFTNSDGGPMSPTNLTRRSFKGLLKQAGLPDMRFHDLRHTHATLLFSHRVHPKIVSERLGRSGIAITMDLYTHHIPTLQEELSPILDRLGMAPKTQGS